MARSIKLSLETNRSLPKVLIIDDSELFGSRLKELLSDIQSVEVLAQARSAKEGLAVLEMSDPDIIFLDIQLPDASGATILPIIREVKPKVSVIVLSNLDTDLQKLLFPRSGGDYYLDKSKGIFKIPEIINKIINAEQVPETIFPLQGRANSYYKNVVATAG
ncbi:MAG: hypothetical protein C5B59_14320 [Bacteroidetes bacterium]|nr:MAG: hypothetical protein C5B59_14320 [Bacteroidota bacterium]